MRRTDSCSDPLVCPLFFFSNPPKGGLKFRLGFPFGPRPAGIHCLQYSNPGFGAEAMPPLLKRPRRRQRKGAGIVSACVQPSANSLFALSIILFHLHQRDARLERSPSSGQAFSPNANMCRRHWRRGVTGGALDGVGGAG